MGESESARKRPSEEQTDESSNIFKSRNIQTTINSIFKKSEREDACQEIALFFYNIAIPFSVAHSEEFRRMLELVAMGLDLSHHPTMRLGEIFEATS